jgi:hypothetical protein
MMGAIPDLAVADLSSSLDASGIDRRLQRITQTTSMWSLPALPDSVKLDLATSQEFEDDDDLDGFLTGLQADIDEQTQRQPIQTNTYESSIARASQQPTIHTAPNSMFLPEDDFTTTLRHVWAGIAGQRAPEIYMADSVQRFKSEAIGRGILSPDTPIDGTWSPQMNQARYEMMQDDFASRLAGNRPGAVSSKNVMDLIGQWATPQGLLGAAVAMDFLPDVNAIKREASGWGDKFRAWWDDKGDVRKMVDAFTGPIDDIALPVINTALLFSGVGNVVTFGRGVMLADDVARGATWATRLAQNPIARHVPGFGRTLDVSAEANRLRQAGIMSQRLSKANSKWISGTGDAMAAWRKQSSVIMAKKAVQQGMRIGFVGQVENLLLPNREGIGLGGAGTVEERRAALGFDDWVGRQMENPLTMGLSTFAELAFAPTSTFDDGFFTKPLSSGASKIKNQLFGLTADKAAGAATIAAGLEKLRLSDPQRYDDLMASLAKAPRRGVDKIKNPQQRIAAELFGGGSVEKAGEVMSYVVLSAGLNAMARQETMRILQVVDPDELSTDWLRTFHVVRDKFINQIRGLDDIDPNSELGRNLWRTYRSNVHSLDEASGDVRKLRKQIWEDLARVHDDADNADLIEIMKDDLAQHADVRTATMKDLLDTVSEADIARVLDEAWDTWGNWDNYTHALREMQELDFEGGGFNLSGLAGMRKRGFEPAALGEQIGGKLLPKLRTRKSWLDSMQSSVQEGRGRITLARTDTATAQQAELLRQQIDYLNYQLRGVRKLEEAHAEETFKTLEAFATERGKTIAKLTDKDLADWRSAAVRSPRVPQRIGLVTEGIDSSHAARYAEAVRYAARNGANPREAAAFLEGKLSSLDNATEMWGKFGVASNVGDLDAKLKQLGRRIEFLAQEVEVPKEVADSFAARGYKVVHGSEFARPDDIIDLNGPLPALSVNDMRRRSLGLFMGRDANTAENINALREQRFRNIFGAELEKLRSAGVDTGAWGAKFAGASRSTDMDEFLDALRQGRLRMLENSEFAAKDDQALGWISQMGSRVRNTGLPHNMYRMNKKMLKSIFGNEFSDQAYDAIIASLRKAEQVGFEYQGLQQLENAFITNSWMRAGLKMFAPSAAADGLKALDRVKRGAGSMRNGQPISAGRDFYQAMRQAWAGGRSYASPTLAARAGGAVIGAGTAVALSDQTGGNPLQAAAAGAGAGLLTPRVLNPRMLARAGLAGIAGVAAGELTGSDEIAGIAGITAALASPRVAGRTLNAFDKRGWAQYSKLSDTARYMRDRLRFSLSPFFDIQRYTEGMMLSTVADVPHGMSLPVTARPMRRFLEDAASRYGEKGMTREAIITEFKQAARGWIDMDQVDTAQAWMYERGIMGFSPTEWMAAAYGQLTRQGMKSSEAVDAVRNIYTYGTKGRSGLEMSANFIFFPFSFQKKYLTDIGKFLSKDMTRTVLLHDSMKMWDTLYEEYDLEEMWKDHLPVLRNMRKINALAFGISPGEFGGINRPFYELGKRLPVVGDAHDVIMNAFLPHALEIKTQSDWEGIRPHVQRMLPVWRDAESMADDLKEQGHVLFSEHHVTSAKEADMGWAEYRDFTAKVHEFAKQSGTSYSAIMNPNNEQFAPLRDYIMRQRVELEKKYPAFVADKQRSTQRAIDRATDIRNITAAPQNEAEAAMAAFQTNIVDMVEAMLGAQGLNLQSDLEAVDEQTFMWVRRKAIAMAREVPEFGNLYRRYYQNTFGPITTEVRR